MIPHDSDADTTADTVRMDDWKRASFQLKSLKDTHLDETDGFGPEGEPCLGGSATERIGWLHEAAQLARPADVFDAFVDRDRGDDAHTTHDVRVIARPGDRLPDLMEGDYIIIRAIGEGPIAKVEIASAFEDELARPGQRLPHNRMVLRLRRCRCRNCRSGLK